MKNSSVFLKIKIIKERSFKSKLRKKIIKWTNKQTKQILRMETSSINNDLSLKNNQLPRDQLISKTNCPREPLSQLLRCKHLETFYLHISVYLLRIKKITVIS